MKADTETAPKPAFDDLMLAMDAVDTLRHETSLLDTELSSDERRAALLLRLREYYAGQGIPVTDDILENAVAEMDRNRFVHEPLAPGLARTLGLAWVRRRKYGFRTAVAALVLATAWVGVSAGHHAFVVAPREKAAAELKVDLATRLPAEASKEHARALAAADEYGDKAARVVADNILAQARSFIAAGEAAAARDEIGLLTALADGIEAKVAIHVLAADAAEARAAAFEAPADAGATAALETAALRMEEAAARGDRKGFEAGRAALSELRRRIDTPLSLSIVDREGVRSGVWRTNDNGRTRVYYLVVEALDPSGRPVSMAIRNSETGRTQTVSHWGVRVPESQYRMLERDKGSDGMINEKAAGTKPAGSLDFQWTIPATGGQMITSW